MMSSYTISTNLTTSCPFFLFSRLGCLLTFFIFFFFNDTATTEIYTLSLHDALPISCAQFLSHANSIRMSRRERVLHLCTVRLDRKSTRLNSSHSQISYAVFCLKKKKKSD